MSTVLVTGGFGFIGGWVIDRLLAHGHRVVALDHHDRVERRTDCETFLGDVGNPEQVCEAMAHVDGWIHLAAVLGTQETVFNPRPAAFTNLHGGLNLLEAAAQYRLPGVYIGVGNHWMQNPYSITKTAVERFVAMYNQERGTQVNIVRGMNAYGPRQRAAPPFASGKVRKIMPAFVCRALCGMPVEVYGDGEQVSDMVWVGNLAATLVHALEDALHGRVYRAPLECGPKVHNTVNAVANEVVEAVMELGRPRVDVLHLPMRPGEIPGSTVAADASTLEAVGIDTDQFVPLGLGVRQTVAWFAEHEGHTWTSPIHTRTESHRP